MKGRKERKKERKEERGGKKNGMFMFSHMEIDSNMYTCGYT